MIDLQNTFVNVILIILSICIVMLILLFLIEKLRRPKSQVRGFGPKSKAIYEPLTLIENQKGNLESF